MPVQWIFTDLAAEQPTGNLESLEAKFWHLNSCWHLRLYLFQVGLSSSGAASLLSDSHLPHLTLGCWSESGTTLCLGSSPKGCSQTCHSPIAWPCFMRAWLAQMPPSTSPHLTCGLAGPGAAICLALHGTKPVITLCLALPHSRTWLGWMPPSASLCAELGYT